MALKDDARQLANDASTLLDRVLALSYELTGIVDRATRLAEQAPAEQASDQRGKKIGRRDLNGKKLRVGDVILVVGSERYGETLASVLGAGPDVGDGKQRVRCALLDGRNDDYTPSVGRVQKYADVRELTEEELGRMIHHVHHVIRPRHGRLGVLFRFPADVRVAGDGIARVMTPSPSPPDA